MKTHAKLDRVLTIKDAVAVGLGAIIGAGFLWLPELLPEFPAQ